VNTPSSRIHSIDLLRGLVMMIMALDHVRDFFHADAMTHDPLDLQTTTPVLFFTRFVTHYCAPIFVFLAGCSAYLSGLKKTPEALSSFLLKRGLWLIAMEVLIVNFGWSFNPLFPVTVFQVIWAIGISMCILGLLVRLPYYAMLTVGLLILFGHNLLDYPEAARDGKVGFWWDLLHHGGFSFYPYAPGRGLFIIYPFLPWTGIMACGYCFGKLFTPGFDAARRKQYLLTLGVGAIVLFVVLRAFDGYGDPRQWDIQERPFYTFLSYIKVSKYPPSLLFSLITIGPGCLLLLLFEKVKISNPLTRMMNVFGRVPFFYYVMHIYLIHTLVVIVFFVAGYGVDQIATDGSMFLFHPPGFGFALPVVYGIWILVLLLLYPLCRRYDSYKTRERKWWLSYL
jgi:uncharacterized membrane protein